MTTRTALVLALFEAEQMIENLGTAAAFAQYDEAGAKLCDYDCKLQDLREEFDRLVRSNANVDEGVCRENAMGVFQDGFTEFDHEFWYVAIACAKEHINGEV